MKISIAISFVILALAAAFGWQNHKQLETVRNSHALLAAEASKLGISTDPSHGADPAQITKRGERVDKDAEAHLVAKDFIAFAKEMEAFEKKGERPDEAMQKRMMEFLDRLMSLDAKQLKILIAEVRAAPRLEGDTRKGLIAFSIMGLSNGHPQAALALFTESADMFSGDGMSQHVISTSLTNWAKEDPMAALEWVRKNGEKFPDLITDDAKRGLIQGASVNDPKLAFKLIAELGITETPSSISAIIVTAKTPEAKTAAFAALREYLATLTDEKVKTAAASTASWALSRNLAAEGFESATKWLESANMTPAELESVTRGLFDNDTSGDTGKWVEWVADKLPTDQADKSIRTLMTRWARSDYQAAGNWLTTVPEGPAKNSSVKSYAETLSKYEPEAAAQWAVTLPPGKDREQTLKKIYQNWPTKDEAGKAAAEAFKVLHGIN